MAGSGTNIEDEEGSRFFVDADTDVETKANVACRRRYADHVGEGAILLRVDEEVVVVVDVDVDTNANASTTGIP